MADKLKATWTDQGWEALRDRMAKGPNKTHCRVGLLGSEADAQHDDDNLTVTEVGLLQEFGSRDKHIPQRSFLRRTFQWSRKNRAEVKRMLAKVSIGSIFRKLTRMDSMKASGIGPWAVQKVIDTINSGIKPENSPETISEKGHDMTLRETFQLMEAISFDYITASPTGTDEDG